MAYREIKHLRKHILEVLESTPKARNSDQYLTLCIWNRYYPRYIKRDADDKPYVLLADVMQLPREDNVKRIRAKIQNVEKKWLPTEEAIAKQRKLNMDEWRVAMGYPTVASAKTDAPSWTPPSEQSLFEQQ